MNKNETPVDAVITWVDGNDEHHQRKRLNALAKKTGSSMNELVTGRDPTRFLDNGELNYCVRSIRAFAPWIRTIHVVTDNQVPEFLTTDLQKRDHIRIVDHRDILASYEWALPVFNSRTIETALWRIPDLAPYFIYFNDDFVLTREVAPDDFFKEDKVVLRGNWNKVVSYGAIRMMNNRIGTWVARHLLGITRSMNLLLQIRSAKLAGFTDRYFRSPHVPHPVRTDTLRSWFADHPALFEKNITYPFRSMDQFSAIFLAHHLEISNNNAHLTSAADLMMLNGEMDISWILNRKLHKIEERQVRFICLHALEKVKKTQRKRINRTLDKLLDGVST